MDFDVSWLGVAFSFVGMCFMVYAWRKTVGNKEFFLELVDDILHEVTTNEDMAKKVFLMGSILGNGLKSGLDIPNLMKGKGKFGMGDLIGIGLKYLGINPDDPTPPSPAPSTPSHEIKKKTPQM